MGTRATQKKPIAASFFIDVSHDFAHQFIEIGEQKLVTAMIERAFLDFYSNNRRNSSSARMWVFDEIDIEEREPFSFNWCCGVLGWCPNELREKLAKRLAVSHRGLYTLKSVKLGTIKPEQQAEAESLH